MKEQIINKLNEIEAQHGVEILFAIESGSRAWGFASTDSDYDIRFVYKRTKEDYLDLWEGKDTIEFMTSDDLDGAGWDLKKATMLLAKSNASFLGWLGSPIVYIDRGETLNNFRKLAKHNVNPVAVFHHYHNMNKGFVERLENGDLTLKSFFYMTRTALCANWALKRGTIPPVPFRDLYALLGEHITKQLDDLIRKKADMKESDGDPIGSELMDFFKKITTENENGKTTIKTHKPDYDQFNLFFKKELT